MGSGREAHGKENPRKYYAVGFRTEPAMLVRGSSRRITIMRFRPANIRVINRRRSSSIGYSLCPHRGAIRIGGRATQVAAFPLSFLRQFRRTLLAVKGCASPRQNRARP